MGKYLKKLPSFAVPLIGCVLAACFLAFALYYNATAASRGNSIGQETGALVGKAIGSLEGITKGREEGTEAGKAAGLSARDTEADIANEIRKIENLEVLVASVKINDVHSIGENIDYAALYLLKGDVVFSVDLSQAEIDKQGNGIQITLPLPHGELYIDQSQIEKVAEYQKHFFSGSAEDGFDAYLNSMVKVYEASAETLDNYDVLIEAAKESAEKQVRQLALSVAVNTHQVNVNFKED